MNPFPIPGVKDLSQDLRGFGIDVQKIYPRSLTYRNGLLYGLIRIPQGKRFFVIGEKGAVVSDPFRGETFRQGTTLKLCHLDAENTDCLLSLFPYTRPTPVLKYPVTVGTGDRLGIATPGHIRAVRHYSVRPVLAQQSVRENGQTGRNFKEVIRDVAWGVFQENYQEGYGADGDHLKSLDEVKDALKAGVSMVTLDLSETLTPEAFTASKEWVDRKLHEELDPEEFKVLSHYFLEKEYPFSGPHGAYVIRFDEESLKRNVLLYWRALHFTEEVFHFLISQKGSKSSFDFEISIDETPYPTTPENHLFFVLGLRHRGVLIDALAPRFIGEFQKGIDYRGDLGAFREQFYRHTLIAEDDGNYKLSIHSGSDKFSIFPEVGRLSDHRFHLKTAGTSWLEAVRLVASMDPRLYREMHRYALSVFREASKLYHVTTDLDRIPKVEALGDRDLPSLLSADDCRQLLHITYGFLLRAQKKPGSYLFRDRLFNLLGQYEEDYWSFLETHIGRHLTSLGLENRDASTHSRID